MLCNRWVIWEESTTRSMRRRSRLERTSALCIGGRIGSCLATIGSSVGLQNVLHHSLPLLVSSCALSLVFSCFVFTVEYTWYCLGLAWVGIDFSSLCSVGGCLTQEFRDPRGFVVALLFLFHVLTLAQPIRTSQKCSISPCRPPDSLWILPSQCHSLEHTGQSWLSTAGAAVCTQISAKSLKGEENIPVMDFRATQKPMYI